MLPRAATGQAAAALASLWSVLLLAGCGAAAEPGEAEAATEAAARAPAVEVMVIERGPLRQIYSATATLEAERSATLVAERFGEVLRVHVAEGEPVTAGQVLAELEASKARIELARQRSVAERFAHDAARQQRLLAQGLVSRELAERARYDHASQDAARALAALDLERMMLRAPFAGIITRRRIEPGQFLAAREAAFEIADFDALRARIAVPEHAAVALAVGQTVQLAADALPGERYSGTVARVAPVVDAKTGTVAATITVDNRDRRLRPGLFVRLWIEQARIADATRLPKAALLAERDSPQVYVVDATDRVALRTLELGIDEQAFVHVRAGLEPGVRVVTLGHAALKPGDLVVPVLVQDATAVPAFVER